MNSMSSIIGPSGSQSAAGVDFNNTDSQSVGSPQTSSTPPTPKTGSAEGSSQLPTLPPSSSSSFSLESLLTAIGNEGRRLSCQEGLNSLEAKAKDQKETNAEELKELQKQIDEMAKKKVLDGFLKAFQIIGTIVGAIASVASIVAGAITGNPLLVAAGVMGMIATVDSVVSLASDGKYSMVAGFTELGKAMGMSDEDAAWFGMSMQIVFMVATIAVSLGAGLSNAAGSAASTAGSAASTAGSAASTAAAATDAVSKTIDKTLNVFLTAQKIANIANAALTTATGAATVAGAVIDYDVAQTKINMKELEAILERIQAAMDMEKALIESKIERANSLMESVSDIVDNCNETQTAILVSSPTLA